MELSDWHLWFKRQGGRELRQILMRDWDPIGVGDQPLGQDEYDGYIGRIAAALRQGSPATDIAAMLTSATDGMGLPPDPARDQRVAEALGSWYPDSIERWATRDR
jgi:hypothetical protein